MSDTTPIPAQFDDSRSFLAVNIAVLTVSDTRTIETDKSGDALVAMIEADGHAVGARTILRDDADLIAQQLESWITDPSIDCVITTGGTGGSSRAASAQPPQQKPFSCMHAACILEPHAGRSCAAWHACGSRVMSDEPLADLIGDI